MSKIKHYISKLEMYLCVNLDKCRGCKTCELACSFRRSSFFSPVESAISILENRKLGITIPIVCQNCSKPICVDVCTSSAMERKNGIIKVNENKCTGCKTCMTSCPFGAISFVSRQGVVRKCNLCDGEPECVKLCPYGAIELINEDKIASKLRQKYIEKILKLYAI